MTKGGLPFVALDNLVSFIVCYVDYPRTAKEFFVSNDECVSITELLCKVGCACEKKLVASDPRWSDGGGD